MTKSHICRKQMWGRRMLLSFFVWSIELQSHGSVSCGCAGSQGCGEKGGFGDFCARCTDGLRSFCVDLDAIGTLRGAGDGERDEFAILATDGSVFSLDDAVEVEP